MARNSKALGILMGAAFAMATVAPSVASAEDMFTSAIQPTVITADGNDNIFKVTNPEFKIHCQTTRFGGTITEKAVKSITILPTYFGTKKAPNGQACEASIGTMTFESNGCSYVLSGETTGKDDAGSDATVSLVCPPGKEMQLTAPANCVIGIPSQTPTAGGVTYTNGINGGKGDITIHLTITGITYTTNLGGCFLPSEGNNIDYTGTITVTGYEDTCKAEECPFGSPVKDEFKEGAVTDIEVS
jgi:hypothetical protein